MDSLRGFLFPIATKTRLALVCMLNRHQQQQNIHILYVDKCVSFIPRGIFWSARGLSGSSFFPLCDVGSEIRFPDHNSC